MTIRAIVKGNGITPERVAAYLPSNYSVVNTNTSRVDGDVVAVYIEGEDSMGWTFDDYVEPRLASGLMFATRLVDQCEHREDDDYQCHGRALGGTERCPLHTNEVES